MPKPVTKRRAAVTHRDTLAKLSEVAVAIDEAASQIEDWRVVRAGLIQRAVAGGVSLSDVGRAAGLSRSAVADIASRQGRLT